MNQEQKDIAAPMRFEQTADLGYRKVRATYAQRGQEYGDTVKLNNWLMLKAIMVELGFERPTDQECRFIFGSAMLDVKYWRNLGGYKEDTLVDGNAYSSHLLGEIELNGGLAPQKSQKPQQAHPMTAEKVQKIYTGGSIGGGIVAGLGKQ